MATDYDFAGNAGIELSLDKYKQPFVLRVRLDFTDQNGILADTFVLANIPAEYCVTSVTFIARTVSGETAALVDVGDGTTVNLWFDDLNTKTAGSAPLAGVQVSATAAKYFTAAFPFTVTLLTDDTYATGIFDFIIEGFRGASVNDIANEVS